MGLGRIFENIVGAVTGNNNDQNNAQNAQYDQNNAAYDEQNDPNILPASMDPYGDPADQQGMENADGGILPASMDPYGDPADDPNAVAYNTGDEQGDILPASMDPYGDPADQQQGYQR
jgi:hypothetical protein